MPRPDVDLLVIGGGAAGLTAAGVGAHLGAKTMLVEADRLGGDCTWTGCVPSKALLHDAARANAARSVLSAHAEPVGGDGLAVVSDGTDALGRALFADAMTRLRDVRREIYEEADAPDRIGRFGIDVVEGRAHFVAPRKVLIDGPDGKRRVSARRVIIATGGRPVVPPIDGLDAVDPLTNETLFELDQRPDRLAIIGGGPIGIEMAQAFHRFGTVVTVINRDTRILGRDDAELAARLLQILRDEGVRFELGREVEHAARRHGAARLTLDNGDVVEADAVLVATGRAPNVDDLGLDTGGVEVGDRGIVTDDAGRTSAKGVFAVGDCADGPRLTHWAEHAAKKAATRALIPIPTSQDTDHLPWVTFTTPELAQLGSTEVELKERGEDYDVYHFPTHMTDRAVAEGTVCETKILARGGRIVGASVLGDRAGEMISEIALAMRLKIPLRKLADTIHPYPSYGLAVRRAADQWYVRRQNPTLVRWLQRLTGTRGPVLTHTPGEIL